MPVLSLHSPEPGRTGKWESLSLLMNIYWSGGNTTHSFWVRLVSVSTIISTKFCFFKFVEMWKDESFTDVTIATEKKIFQVGNFFWNVKTEGFVTVSLSGAQVDIVSLQSLLQTPIFQLVSSASSDCDTEGGNISIKCFYFFPPLVLPGGSRGACFPTARVHVLWLNLRWTRLLTLTLSILPPLVISLFKRNYK